MLLSTIRGCLSNQEAFKAPFPKKPSGVKSERYWRDRKMKVFRGKCFAVAVSSALFVQVLSIAPHQAARADVSLADDRPISRTVSYVLATAGTPRCGNRSDLVEWLSQGYSEQWLGQGVSREGLLVELFVAPDSRSWTVIVTRPDGVTCLVSAGHGWEGTLPVESSAQSNGV